MILFGSPYTRAQLQGDASLFRQVRSGEVVVIERAA